MTVTTMWEGQRILRRRMAQVVICAWAVLASACVSHKRMCEGTACADGLDAGERGTLEEPTMSPEADAGVQEPRAKLCSATPVEGGDRIAPEDRVDGASLSLACGLDGRGLRALRCSAGTWLVLPCRDPDAGGFADSGGAGSAGGCQGTVDSCGVCDGGDLDRDCAGICFGATMVDCDGVCAGHAQIDCAGVCGGGAVLDCAGVCGGGAALDCAGVCGGGAVLDCAGVCDGGAAFDCAGLCGGGSVLDCAGQCNGSAQRDCAGTCNGFAQRDCAGVCDGSMQLDCTGVCGGLIESDCAGVCGGGAQSDDCGICNGNNAFKDCAGVCFGSDHESCSP